MNYELRQNPSPISRLGGLTFSIISGLVCGVGFFIGVAWLTKLLAVALPRLGSVAALEVGLAVVPFVVVLSTLRSQYSTTGTRAGAVVCAALLVTLVSADIAGVKVYSWHLNSDTDTCVAKASDYAESSNRSWSGTYYLRAYLERLEADNIMEECLKPLPPSQKRDNLLLVNAVDFTTTALLAHDAGQYDVAKKLLDESIPRLKNRIASLRDVDPIEIYVAKSALSEAYAARRGNWDSL